MKGFGGDSDPFLARPQEKLQPQGAHSLAGPGRAGRWSRHGDCGADESGAAYPGLLGRTINEICYAKLATEIRHPEAELTHTWKMAQESVAARPPD
jgi:hypothetical protein